MARVELNNVSKLFGSIRAVDAMDLTVQDQEFVVLVGPSGCGKSTTLRMVAGLESVSEGIIRIGGRVVNDVPPPQRDIAMVFQNYALYPHMTVYRNMAFALKLRGVPKAQIDRRVRDAARTLEIEHLLERRPRELSGGQRQRVAVGRAIVREPAAFLFDEPLSNLDAKLRVSTRAELKRLHNRLRTTTIYVTHDQEEAMTLGDRIVVMRDGHVQQADAPLVTYNHPANRFVAGFIGMPPMNFFDGVLRNEAGRLLFEEGRLVRPAANGDENGTAGELSVPGNGFRLVLPDLWRSRLEPWSGRHLVLGIRPEHFLLACGAGASGDWAELTVKVNVIEPLGSDMDVYLETPLHDRVVARVDAQEGLMVNSQVTMYVDLRKIHFFEPGSAGVNLSLLQEADHAIG